MAAATTSGEQYQRRIFRPRGHLQQEWQHVFWRIGPRMIGFNMPMMLKRFPSCAQANSVKRADCSTDNGCRSRRTQMSPEYACSRLSMLLINTG